MMPVLVLWLASHRRQDEKVHSLWGYPYARQMADLRRIPLLDGDVLPIWRRQVNGR